MASVHTFVDGKLMFKDKIAYANGDYVFLKDYKILECRVKELQCELEKNYNQLMEVEKDAHEQIAELEKTRSDWVDNAVTWKEKFEKAEKEIKELESELEVKENLLKIKNGLCGNDEMKDKEPIEIAMDIIKGRNIDDLEQIAQHIQVYCRHTRSSRDDTIAF